jgi:hypothetical protein
MTTPVLKLGRELKGVFWLLVQGGRIVAGKDEEVIADKALR